MPRDFAQWGFLLLVTMIAGPFIFWFISMLVVWVRWLFVKKKKVNESYGELYDFKREEGISLPIRYRLGKDSMVVINILNEQFNLVFEVYKDTQAKGEHLLAYDASRLDRGIYFCQIITDNQKLTKKFVVG